MSPANDDVYQWNTFSPRVGINYRLKIGQTVVKAHYGRYYNALERDSAACRRDAVVHFQRRRGRQPDEFLHVAAANLRSIRTSRSRTRPVHRAGRAAVDARTRPAGELRPQAGRDTPRWKDIAGQYVSGAYVDNVGIDATGETVMVYRLMSHPGDRLFLLTNPAGCTCVTTA